MNNSWVNVFVDESGTNELDSTKQGVSNLFICVAVVVDDEHMDEVTTAINDIRKKLCSGAEIKSSRIASNHDRRLQFLRGIEKLPFRYYALVINKDAVYSDSGYQYKRTFYKAVHRRLYNLVSSSGKSLRVKADEIGGQDYMEGFDDYLKDKDYPNLFTQFEHSFVKSENEPVIQLADLIAGTLGYCFDETKKSEKATEFRKILRKLEVAVDCWPPLPMEVGKSAGNQWDEKIREAARRRAISFIEENENSSEIDEQIQAATLKRLFFAREFEDREDQTIFSDSLIASLENEGFGKISKQAFTSRIIGKLRFEGVVISGSKDGYRLALSHEDIHEYLCHDKTIIEPMLARIGRARQAVQEATEMKLDILAEEPYLVLGKILEAAKDYDLDNSTKRLCDEEEDETEEKI